VLFAACTGCLDAAPLSISADPGDLVVVAIARSDGRVQSGEMFVAGDPPPHLQRGEDERVFSFVLRRQELVGGDGRALGEQFVRGARLRIGRAGESENPASCGRCLIASDRAPLIAHSGDVCPIPAFAGDDSDPLRELVRASLLISWPGSCECSAGAPNSVIRGEVDHRLLLSPEASFWPPEASTIAPDGTTALVSEHVAAMIAPDGRLDEAPDPGALFDDQVLVAAATNGDAFLVASHHVGGARDVRYSVLTRDLRIAAIDDDVGVRAYRMRYSPFDDTTIALGRGIPQRPGIVACAWDVASSRLTCARIVPEDIALAGENTFDVAVREDGFVAIGGSSGMILLERTLDPRAGLTTRVEGSDRTSAHGTNSDSTGRTARWRAFHITVAAEGGMLEDFVHLRRIHLFEDRIVACAVTDDPRYRGSGLVLTAPLDRTHLDPIAAPPVFEIIHRSPTDLCAGMLAIPGRSDRIRVGFRDAAAVVVTSTGSIAKGISVQSLPVNLASTSIETPVSGWSLLHTLDGHVMRRRDDWSGALFERIYGTEGAINSQVISIVERNNELWAFHVESASIVAADGSVRSIPYSGFGPTDAIASIAADTSTGELVALVYDAALVGPNPPKLGEPSIWRASFDQLAFSRVELSSKPSLTDVVLRDLAEAAPGVFVVIGEDARIFRLTGDVLDEVTIEWDDKSTQQVEPKPAFERVCENGALRGHNKERDQLRDVHGSLGVAWVVGCPSLVLRVLPLSSPPRAERMLLDRPTQSMFGPEDELPIVSAVHARCPDDLFVAAQGSRPTDKESGRVWWVHPDDEPATNPEPPFGTLRVSDAPGLEANFMSREQNSGRPIAIAAFGPYVAIAFQSYDLAAYGYGAAEVLGDPERFRIADAITAIGASSSGRVLYGTGGGRLILESPR
jgi:hypothetical protein